MDLTRWTMGTLKGEIVGEMSKYQGGYKTKFFEFPDI